MLPAPVAPPQAANPYQPPPPAGPAKIALLLPLSGPNAKLGKALLDAAQLAFFDSGGKGLELVPRDTGGTPAGAAKAARAVVADQARLVLGPLLKFEVAAVKPLAAAANVPVIAFSTATDLAGGNVFLMGFLPRAEAVREVGYARQRGHRRFAALVPNSPYGQLMAKALREAVGASGGEVTQVAVYDPGEADVGTAIRQLLPAGGAGPAAAPAFDALLLPEGGGRLKAMARQLAVAGLDTSKVQLLGSGLWDEPDAGSEPALVGGWFAAASPEARRGFEERFGKIYGYKPPLLASLGYDAVALAAVLSRGEGGAPFSRAAILNPRGFSGVDGLFRFTADGLVQRGLAVLQVGPQGNAVVSPAPQSFENLGF
ncbi:MAG TPA: penicillin-binding protein activator [Stellaceae bacterium]|nr:penicillin-binding protein activator [Stellaceae bacterium]